MFEKFAEDVARKYQEKLAAIKEANSLRDAVRLGRISPETFKELRQSKKYLPFEQYQNMKGLDKATYFQSLMKDLKSKLRGKGKNGAPSQYDNFMKNDFKGDFTEDQYNKLFGYQTEFPSLGRMARGTIKGVHNRAADINEKIDKYNASTRQKWLLYPDRATLNKNYGKEQLPKINLTEPSRLNDLVDLEGELGISKEEADMVRALIQQGAFTVTGKNNIASMVPSTIPSSPLDPDNSKKPFHASNFADVLGLATNFKDMEGGLDIGTRAALVDHEFNEALNALNQLKNKAYGVKDMKKRSVISSLLNDSHNSADVVGREYLTNNAIFGPDIDSPLRFYRTMQSFPFKSLPFPGGNISGQTIGLDYSRPDGGLGNKFRRVKQFNKHLKNIQKNEMKAIEDEDFFDQVIRSRSKLNPVLAPTLRVDPDGPVDPEFIAQKTKEYFPYLNLVSDNENIKDSINRYYDRFINRAKKLNLLRRPENSSLGIDGEKFLNAMASANKMMVDFE